MKKIWIISDTHFNHDKMVDYCNRPKNFEELIIKNLEVIKVEDILIHLGDVCFGNDKENNKKLTQLKCKKWLVKGNHDKKSNKWYLENGWDFVCESFSDNYFGKKILFSHCPMPAEKYDLNIHGHFHNALPRLLRGEWKVEGEKERNEQDLLNLLNGKHKLVALEETNYKPILLNSLCPQNTTDK